MAEIFRRWVAINFKVSLKMSDCSAQTKICAVLHPDLQDHITFELNKDERKIDSFFYTFLPQII